MTDANVGTLYYSVKSDTAQAVKSADTLDDSLDSLTTQFGKVDSSANKFNTRLKPIPASINQIGREADSANNALGGMSKILLGFASLQGVKTLIDMAETYGEMSERVRMATSSLEEYDMVQQRLLQNANSTYRTLSESSEVYIRIADSIRAMGYNTEQALDVVDSLSYLFVTNATSAERANNTISAFTKSLNKGKVEVDGWETILAAVPSIINDIAAASGKTAQEIRAMGVSGDISAKMLTEGLAQSLQKNADAAADMATNLKDAFRNFNNSLSVYLGEANNASGATGVLSNAIITLGDNISTIVTLLTVAGAGALARYIASTAASAIASAKATLAARQQAIEQLKMAQANAAAATSAAAAAAANAGLTTTFASAAVSARASAVATDALAIAQRNAAATGATLMGLFGGPVGLIGLAVSAAAGLLLYATNSKTAEKSMLDMGQPLDALIAKFNELTASQRALAIQQAQTDIAASIKELDSAMADLTRGTATDGTAAMARWRGATSDQVSEIINLAKNGKISYQEMDSQLVKLITDYAAATGRSQEWVNAQLALAGQVATTAKNMSDAQGRASALASAQNGLADATRGAANAQRDLNAELMASGSETGKYLQTLTDRANKLRDGNSAVKEAQRYLGTLKEVTDEYRDAVLREAAAIDKMSAAKKSATTARKEESAEAKKAAAASKEEDKQNEQNVKILTDMVNALNMASLSGADLAAAKATAQLNAFATPEELVALDQMARKLYEIEQIEARKKAIGTDPNKFITGTVDPLKGGVFDEQTARYEAEKLAEETRYAEQLQRLNEAKAEQVEVVGGYYALEEQLAQTHADRLAQIEQARFQVMLKSGEQGFGAIADMLKQSQGEQSGIYKAMFAASKAFAIAQAIVSIQQGIAQAAANPWPLNLAAMASVAAATAGLVSNISSVTMGGGRQYGGPVSDGSMHRINENGQPEVLNMANGRQYLLPNGNGQVVSNKDATSGGPSGGNVTINLIEDSSRGGQVNQRQGDDQQKIIDVFVADIRGGGTMSQTLERTYDMNRIGS